jgi:hypothetical protein
VPPVLPPPFAPAPLLELADWLDAVVSSPHAAANPSVAHVKKKTLVAVDIVRA